MMLSNLLHEIVSRRLWPIPLLAVIAAIAAPVLFLKHAPPGAPAASSAAPAPAAAGELPARAQRLLAATGEPAGARGRATGAERDPFQPPAGARAAAAKTAETTSGGSHAPAAPKSSAPAKPASPAPGTPSNPIPVVIQNADGTASTTTAPQTTTGSAGGATAGSSSAASVDVRFGESAGGRVHRAIPRLQPFYIHGKLAAVFVKYSPGRNKAVFAVSPGLLITGPVKCREQAGVCRYLDIPAGSYARLTMVTSDRVLVRRRLDVERIRRGADAPSTTAAAARDRSENACLLDRLRTLEPDGAPIDRDACER